MQIRENARNNIQGQLTPKSNLFFPLSRSWINALGLVLLMAVGNAATLCAQETSVQVVVSSNLKAPARHGVEQLCEAMREHGLRVETLKGIEEATGSHVIVAGLADNPAVADRITEGGLALPQQAESLAIQSLQNENRKTVVLCGADAAGLMYAALDTAQRIGWAHANQDPFTHIHNTSESPFVGDRSVSMYTMHRAWFEQRLYDPVYWEHYFDMLAASRINSYVIIFGYECAGFMAPMYPYFYDVAGFPDIRFNGLSSEAQTRNAAALKRVIALAHERGIRITLGIWDHIYRGRVQAGGIEWAAQKINKATPHTVYGVTAENLAPYTKAALKKLLSVFPGIDAIQFRMHGESGLTRDEIPRFWRDVFSMLQELKPTLRFDLRAKGLPDEVIENAIQEKLPFRIATKFWMEQVGMPFHPTHIPPANQRDRRHGYADLLRYPKQYDVHWRIWSGGTLRMLLWGDPDHVRRFVKDSVTLYGGNSFEVNEMLATKMLGRPHDQTPFQLHVPAYQHYDYEIERYWHFFQLWGRIAYNPKVDPNVWQQEFAQRYGEKSGPLVMQALHQASGILPKIVAASYNYHNFPTTRGWAGMMRLGDLARYAQGTGTDTEQFQSYAAAAKDILENHHTTLQTPQQSAAWLAARADQVLYDMTAAQAIDEPRDMRAEREFSVALSDLRILANLAQYHAARMPAAIWYNIYLQTKSSFALERCLAGEANAMAAWQRIMTTARGVYPESLWFGSTGMEFPEHWSQELAALQAGYKELSQLPSQKTMDADARERCVQGIKAHAPLPLFIDLKHAGAATPGRDLVVTASDKGSGPPKAMKLRYRHVTQFEDYKSVDMTWDSQLKRFSAHIPGAFITPQWDLMYFVEALDHKGRSTRVPNWESEQPYVIVPLKR